MPLSLDTPARTPGVPVVPPIPPIPLSPYSRPAAKVTEARPTIAPIRPVEEKLPEGFSELNRRSGGQPPTPQPTPQPTSHAPAAPPPLPAHTEQVEDVEAVEAIDDLALDAVNEPPAAKA